MHFAGSKSTENIQSDKSNTESNNPSIKMLPPNSENNDYGRHSKESLDLQLYHYSKEDGEDSVSSETPTLVVNKKVSQSTTNQKPTAKTNEGSPSEIDDVTPAQTPERSRRRYLGFPSIQSFRSSTPCKADASPNVEGQTGMKRRLL